MDIPKIKKKEDNAGKKKDKEDSDIELLSSDSDTITTQRRSVYVTSLSFIFYLLLKWLCFRGPLAKVKWYRIVIDEAQNIRNRYCFPYSYESVETDEITDQLA